MKVAVVGLWHLGCVTAASLAKVGHDVIAYDPDNELIKTVADLYHLNRAELIALPTNKLHFSTHSQEIADADVVWITYDTPVNENDIADSDNVKNKITELAVHIKNNALLLLSSQLPVGTTSQLKKELLQKFPTKKFRFSYSPENLRLGKALEIFQNPDRIVVGLENQTDKEILSKLLFFSQNIIWMSIESAEMTKHALNAFLALSVTFINEVASLCEKVGANPQDVEIGLKSETRIGNKAYFYVIFIT